MKIRRFVRKHELLSLLILVLIVIVVSATVSILTANPAGMTHIEAPGPHWHHPHYKI